MRRARVLWLVAVAVLLVSQTPALSAVFNITINRMAVPQPTRAVLRSGHLMMPLRSLEKLVGFTATWEQDTHTAVATAGAAGAEPGATDETVVVRMPVGSEMVTVNGEPVELAAPAEIINDTTYVPAEFLAKAFGGQIEWEAIDTGAVGVTVNGEFHPLNFATIIRNEHVMVPVIRVAEKLFEAKGIWHEPDEAVYANTDQHSLRVTVGSADAYANGKATTLGAPAELIDDLVYVPLRFVVEAFGGAVEWDADTRTLNVLL